MGHITAADAKEEIEKDVKRVFQKMVPKTSLFSVVDREKRQTTMDRREIGPPVGVYEPKFGQHEPKVVGPLFKTPNSSRLSPLKEVEAQGLREAQPKPYTTQEQRKALKVSARKELNKTVGVFAVSTFNSKDTLEGNALPKSRRKRNHCQTGEPLSIANGFSATARSNGFSPNRLYNQDRLDRKLNWLRMVPPIAPKF